jgi:hypothetical protein
MAFKGVKDLLLKVDSVYKKPGANPYDSPQVKVFQT